MVRDTCTAAVLAGGAVATLGIGAAILACAGAASADATSGSGSGSGAASSSTRSSAGPASSTHSVRSAQPAAATIGNTTMRSTGRPVLVRTAAVFNSAAAPTKPVVPSAQAAPSTPQTKGATAASAVPRSGPSTWGAPTRTVNFTDSSVLSQFVVYEGQTPEGNRTADALSFANGTMTITGDAQGNDEGIAWTPGQKYGAWEVRLRVPPGAANYDPVLLLWPDAEDWPRGGEVDFMEMWNDPQRQRVNSVLHYGTTNTQVSVGTTIDATQWHTYAVKWTPTRITTYVDAIPLFVSTDTSTFPPDAMHLCIQLDTQGSDIGAGAQMEVAWAKQYSLAAVT